MGIVELQPEEISRRARLPQQAKLEVTGRRELMAAGEIKPVLVEIAFAAVEVNEGLVEGVDEVGTGFYGLVVKRYRDLQPVTPPIGVTVAIIFRKPALLESEPMLEFCPRPGLLQGKLLVEPILLSQAISAVIKRPGINAHVAETDHGDGIDVVVARESPEDLVQVRGRLPQANLALAKYTPVVREADSAVYANPITQLVLGPNVPAHHPKWAEHQDDRCKPPT